MKRVCLLFLFVVLLFIPASPATASVKTLGELKIGDKVVDNSWEWEHRIGDNYTGAGEIKPITWIVVAKDHYGPGSGVTLLAEELIGKFTFGAAPVGQACYVSVGMSGVVGIKT